MKKYLIGTCMGVMVMATTAHAQSLDTILRGISNGLSRVTGQPVAESGVPGGKAPAFGSLEKADIAGVRLEMTPEQASTALLGMGYKIANTYKGPSFEQRARAAAMARNPALKFPDQFTESTVREIVATGPSGEYLSVGFVALPTGPVVRSVRVSFDTGRITRASFTQMIYAKYGPPTDAQVGMMWYYWCNAGTVDCAHRAANYRHLQYTAGPADPVLELTAENVMGARQKTLLDAEVDRIAPMGTARF